MKDEQNQTEATARDGAGSELTRLLGRISPTALQDATTAVNAFGCSMAQAAQALRAVGEAANALEAEDEMLMRESESGRPMYRG